MNIYCYFTSQKEHCSELDELKINYLSILRD